MTTIDAQDVVLRSMRSNGAALIFGDLLSASGTVLLALGTVVVATRIYLPLAR